MFYFSTSDSPCPPFHSFTPGMWCNGNIVSLKKMIHGSIPWLANSQIPFQVWETSRYKVGISWHSYRPTILEYPSGDGAVLIKLLPWVRFSPLELKPSTNTTSQLFVFMCFPSISAGFCTCSSVVEQRTFNPFVASSNPVRCIICWYGGIGRRIRFKLGCQQTWGFKSLYQQLDDCNRLNKLWWWNWNTCVIQNHVPKGLWVRVPLGAWKLQKGGWGMSQKMRYEYCPTCKRGFEYSSEDCV